MRIVLLFVINDSLSTHSQLLSSTAGFYHCLYNLDYKDRPHCDSGETEMADDSHKIVC